MVVSLHHSCRSSFRFSHQYLQIGHQMFQCDHIRVHAVYESFKALGQLDIHNILSMRVAMICPSGSWRWSWSRCGVAQLSIRGDTAWSVSYIWSINFFLAQHVWLVVKSMWYSVHNRSLETLCLGKCSKAWGFCPRGRHVFHCALKARLFEVHDVLFAISTNAVSSVIFQIVVYNLAVRCQFTPLTHPG